MREEIGVIQNILDAQLFIFRNLKGQSLSPRANAPAPAGTAARGISTEYDEYTRPRNKSSSYERRHVSNYDTPTRVRDKEYYPAHGQAVLERYDDDEMFAGMDEYSSGFKLTPTNPEGFRKLFFEECFRILTLREREFEEFDSKASRLELVVCPQPSSPFHHHTAYHRSGG